MQVVALGFAAVKGTRHLARDVVDLDGSGPVGDRHFCVVDVERRRVLRTVQHRTLLTLRAKWDGDVLALRLPDGRAAVGRPTPSGEEVTCEYWGRRVAHRLVEGPHAALLSEHLGRPVRLAVSPRGGVVYGDPVSLMTTASLRDLAERADRLDLLDPAGGSWSRFRMTAVLDGAGEPYAEDQWAGRVVDLGGTSVRVTGPVPRCGVIDLDPATGAKDGSLLKLLAGFRPSTGGEPWFGVDATVVDPGPLRPGDAWSVR